MCTTVLCLTDRSLLKLAHPALHPQRNTQPVQWEFKMWYLPFEGSVENMCFIILEILIWNGNLSNAPRQLLVANVKNPDSPSDFSWMIRSILFILTSVQDCFFLWTIAQNLKKYGWCFCQFQLWNNKVTLSGCSDKPFFPLAVVCAPSQKLCWSESQDPNVLKFSNMWIWKMYEMPPNTFRMTSTKSTLDLCY